MILGALGVLAMLVIVNIKLTMRNFNEQTNESTLVKLLRIEAKKSIEELQAVRQENIGLNQEILRYQLQESTLETSRKWFGLLDNGKLLYVTFGEEKDDEESILKYLSEDIVDLDPNRSYKVVRLEIRREIKRKG